MNTKTRAVAENLVRTKAKEIDLARDFSLGPKGGKNFVSEASNGQSLNIELTNESVNDHIILFGSAINSQFVDNAALMAATGATAIIDDGVILIDTAKNITAVRTDPGRTINQAMRYISNSPTRFTKMDMESHVFGTNAPDSSNFTTKLKTVFASPWDEPAIDYINLRKTQSNASNSPQFAQVDFLKEGKQVCISNENFFLVTVKKGTVLNLSISVGMQNSSAQRFYRGVKKADEVLAPMRGK